MWPNSSARGIQGTIARTSGSSCRSARSRLLIDMTIELADVGHRQRSARGLAPWLILLFVGSAAVGVWFLLEPLLTHRVPYYGVGYNRTTYEYLRQLLPVFVPYAMALWAW